MGTSMEEVVSREKEQFPSLSCPNNEGGMNADAPNKAVFFKKSLRVFIINKIKINHYILKALLNAYFRKKIQLCFSSLWTLTIIIQLSRHKYRYIYYLCNT
jgi:hypothetical protein